MRHTPITNDVTELAKERNRQAAERTITSWINVSLLLVGLGISLEQIPILLQRSFPQRNPAIHLQLSYLLGLGTIALGVMLLLPVVFVHRQSLKVLAQPNYLGQPTRWNLNVVLGLVILIGVVAIVNVILIISQQ